MENLKDNSENIVGSDNDTYTFVAESKDNDIRVDIFLSEKTEKTRSFIQKLADDGYLLVNNKKQKKNYKLSNGDIIKITIPFPKECEVLAENIPLDIVYEDEYLLVVDKPKGMVVHPAPGNYNGTLVNALMYHCGESLSGINGYIRPGIVHRIDMDTSGLLIVAKNDDAHRGLAEQISKHSFTRMYEAVVVGNLKEDKFQINLPIGRHPINRKKMAVTYENSRNAISNVEVIKRYGKYTHIRVFLETGRTHQIRVHLSHIGHPVLGDEVYSPELTKFKGLKGQCLLARYIQFIHPIYGNTLSFEAEMPEYFKNVISFIEKTTI